VGSGGGVEDFGGVGSGGLAAGSRTDFWRLLPLSAPLPPRSWSISLAAVSCDGVPGQAFLGFACEVSCSLTAARHPWRHLVLQGTDFLPDLPAILMRTASEMNLATALPASR